jgi:hypothetical protein
VFAYSAFRLGIVSELPLDGLTPGDGRADVRVELGDLKSRVDALRQARRSFAWTPDETLLYWKDIGAFLVRGGQSILVEPVPDADPGEIQIALLGPVVAALLAQRGHLLLHASAVAIDGKAVLFLGTTRSGKSTLASALHARGHPLVVDDLSAIDLSGDTPSLLRGWPYTKLWPDSLAAMGEDPESLPRIADQYVKRRRSFPSGFYGAESLPVGCFYVLTRGERAAVTPLTPAEAFAHLTANSYGIRWFLQEVNAGQFHERARLAREVPARRLERPAELERLTELVHLVERDARGALGREGTQG